MQTVLLVLMQINVLPAKTGTMLKELAVRPAHLNARRALVLKLVNPVKPDTFLME